jgi:UDP-N-acetylmuramoylalanine--D-glutamate ligase
MHDLTRTGSSRFLATDLPERFGALTQKFLDIPSAPPITFIHLIATPSASLLIERYPDMIMSSEIEGQKFAVLGLGKSGLATAEFLRASKAEAILWDDKPEARERAASAGFTVADLAQIDPTGFQALVLSPGIPHTFPKPHPVALRFREKNVPIIGDIELLFRACPKATYIGVTGTNGKSTTTSLIGHILKQAGYTVQIGGNLGTPALSLKPLGEDGIYVLELSSYQLELIETNSINYAVLLNVTPDHIDRHGDMAGYMAAKMRIISSGAPQTLIIGNEEPETRAIASEARKYKHLTVKDIIVDCVPALIDTSTLPTLLGSHNWQNAYAAYLTCRALGVASEAIIKAEQEFPGLDHRQKLVAEINGVRFINDSKATNANAAGKALSCYDNIYWIIGGQQKEGGLTGLEDYMPRVRQAFLIGQASDEFAVWCQDKVPFTLCGTLDIAVAKAAEAARKDNKGGVVLLSPACASWDQFKNFEDRGEKFAEYVGKLKSA